MNAIATSGSTEPMLLTVIKELDLYVRIVKLKSIHSVNKTVVSESTNPLV